MLACDATYSASDFSRLNLHSAAIWDGNLRRVFLSRCATWITPALVGTFVIAGVLALLGNEFNDDFFWMALVVVWALTVPHMAVTAKLDRSALT
jgi:beta-carotene 15,15'-dioxygenase